MWHEYSAHHIQRGDVTAVVWGAPGERPPTSLDSGENNAPPLPPTPTAAAASAGHGADHSRSRWRVDSEALTRGRRDATPFVQQCDLIFPLPNPRHVRNDGGGDGDTSRGSQGCDGIAYEEKQVAEAEAEV